MTRTQKWITIFLVVAMAMFMICPVSAQEQGKININTATVEELVQLDRVGPRYAEKIIAFRQENGPFKTPEDIMLVAGIGQKTFELNKDRIVVK
jgi:competence protein ComEA